MIQPLRALAAFSSGPGFDSHHPRGSSQLPVTQVPRDPVPSLSSVGSRHPRGSRHSQTYMQSKHSHI